MWDCAIIGGGIAGLQAAIQLGRYEHTCLVLDSNQGRSTRCRNYHNLLGWPDGVSGLHLRTLGRRQAAALGTRFDQATVQRVAKDGESFTLTTASEQTIQTKTLLIATGIVDHIPPIPGLEPALGLSVYVCPDCDGFECRNRTTVVMGAGRTGAEMALTLKYWTDDVTLVLHSEEPAVPEEWMQKLNERGVRVIAQPVTHVECDAASMLESILLADGQQLFAERGFVAFGGNQVQSALAVELGVKRLNERHILVNPRTKMTNVKGVWAAGDVVAHSEQVSIAMADGSQAAIFIHKYLLGQEVPMD